MPKTLKPKPLPPMTEARFKQWATHEASIHVTHFRRVLAALEYERQRADAAEKRALSTSRELDAIRPNHWHD